MAFFLSRGGGGVKVARFRPEGGGLEKQRFGLKKVCRLPDVDGGLYCIVMYQPGMELCEGGGGNRLLCHRTIRILKNVSLNKFRKIAYIECFSTFSSFYENLCNKIFNFHKIRRFSLKYQHFSKFSAPAAPKIYSPIISEIPKKFPFFGAKKSTCGRQCISSAFFNSVFLVLSKIGKKSIFHQSLSFKLKKIVERFQSTFTSYDKKTSKPIRDGESLIWPPDL